MIKEEIWEHLALQLREASSKASIMWKYHNMINHLFHLPKLEDIVIPHWKLLPIVGKSPEGDFWYRLSRGIFNINQNLRDEEHLEYLEERDLFHDLFGHGPALFSPDITDYLIGLGNFYENSCKSPEIQKVLSNLYWFTAEFGLIMERGKPKVLGAGILSSKAELKHVFSGEATILPFSIKEVINEPPYITDGFQERYYLLDTKDQFKDILKYLWKNYI